MRHDGPGRWEPVGLSQEAITLLQQLIRHNTVNPPGNERPAQELLRSELEAAGATIGAKGLCEQVPEKVRCDMIVNEGAGEVLDFEGRRFYTVVVGEKGVFRFKLTTEGRAGHASMPDIGDNALLRMVALLSRLDGRQPPFDAYPAGIAPLEALVGDVENDLAGALERVRAVE